MRLFKLNRGLVFCLFTLPYFVIPYFGILIFSQAFFLLNFVIIVLQIIDVLKQYDKDETRQINYKRLYIDIFIFCLSIVVLAIFSLLFKDTENTFLTLLPIIPGVIIYAAIFDFSGKYMRIFFKAPSRFDIFCMGIALLVFPFGIYYLQYKFKHILKYIIS